MASANVATSLASAMAAATLASQQAAQYAASTDPAAGRFAFNPIPSQHWELLRVAELFSTRCSAGVAAPPLFLPSLGPALSAPTASLPKAPPPILVGSAAVSAGGSPLDAAPASSAPPGQHSALLMPDSAVVAPSKAARQASPTHAEPQTPELTPANLRSPKPPALVAAAANDAASPLAAAAVAPPRQLSAHTVVGRPIAIRPVPHAGTACGPVLSRPLTVATQGAHHPCESPPSIPSPGAAFSVVVKPMGVPAFQAPPQQQHLQLSPQPAAGLAAVTPVAAPSAGPEPKAALPQGACAKNAGARKRRGTGPGSPHKRRAGSPDSVTEEGCGDSMERATGYKGRFCGRLFLKEDEKRLAEECEALGPLVGFPGPGKRGHCTVAKLARSIVAGSVRHVCEQRVAEIQALQRQVEEQRAAEEARTQQMALENAALRQELAVYRSILGNALGPAA